MFGGKLFVTKKNATPQFRKRCDRPDCSWFVLYRTYGPKVMALEEEHNRTVHGET